MSQETGKLRTFTLHSPIKVKFSESEIIDYAAKQLGAGVADDVLRHRVAELRARCDANGYLTMDLHELMQCLQLGVKDENSVGEMLVYNRATENDLTNFIKLPDQQFCK